MRAMARAFLTVAGILLAPVVQAVAAETVTETKIDTATKIDSSEPAEKPHHWVRALAAVQDQIAQGSASAHAYQTRLVTEIATRFESVPVDVLKEPQNIRAALAFVLSGGDPGVLRRLLRAGTSSDADLKLVKGVLAYAEGKYSEASGHLDDIAARKLDPTLAGRIALVQSILIYKRDLKKAIKLLDDARLLGTGTLVEEAALRRQVVLVAGQADYDRFEQLSNQYFRRFGRSVYAEYFREQFSNAASALDFNASPERLTRLQGVVDTLTKVKRKVVYLMLAEKGIFVGNLPLTKFAARQGSTLSKPGSLDWARCELYEASALVASAETELASEKLAAVRGFPLSGQDASLLKAAVSIAEQVVRKPEESPPLRAESAQDRDEEGLAKQTKADEETQNIVLAAAQKAIGSADGLLKGAPK